MERLTIRRLVDYSYASPILSKFLHHKIPSGSIMDFPNVTGPKRDESYYFHIKNWKKIPIEFVWESNQNGRALLGRTER